MSSALPSKSARRSLWALVQAAKTGGRVEMDFENLRYEVQDGLARLTLARPPRNQITLATARELMDAAIRQDEDERVRAVLISAEGQAFSVGGDLREFIGADEELPMLLKELTVYLHTAVSRLVRSRAPVVCAVGGPVAGGGLSLVLASDLVLAAEGATFSYGYSKIGFSPDGSSTYFLPRLLGARRAAEFALIGRALSAEEALEWGLINRVVPDAELEEVASELAAELAEGPTIAFGAAKSLLHQSWTETLETQMELEARALSDTARTADAREGVAAFLAKRSARFTGR